VTIDAALLRWCTLENLERLARSLGIEVLQSGSRERRHKRLVWQIVDALEDEALAKKRGSDYREGSR
jgi:hypothetical protein